MLDDTTAIKTLVDSEPFKQQVAAYFGVPEPKTVAFEKFSRGTSKIVWKISSPELPGEFLVKEIRFPDPLSSTVDSMAETNHTLDL